jgi:hypothetical protein
LALQTDDGGKGKKGKAKSKGKKRGDDSEEVRA